MSASDNTSAPRSIPATLYCATCDKKRVECVNDLLGGTRYVCPESTFWEPHVACVGVKGSEMHGWLRFQVVIQQVVGLPYALLKRSKTSSPWSVGVIKALSVSLLTVSLAIAPRFPHIAIFVTYLLLFYMLATNTATVFVSRRPRDAFRANVFAMISFVELILGFAALYRSLPASEFVLPMSSAERSVYFTAVTFATVGFGDIRPADDASVARLLVTAQIIVGLYFVTVIFTSIVSFVTGGSRPLTLQELLEHSKRLDSIKPHKEEL
jgi:hypothetical protein